MERLLVDILHNFGRHALGCPQPQEVTVSQHDCTVVGCAEVSGGAYQRVEHHLKLESGATDYLEHFGGGGLPL
jgi:hypothetical protein